MGCLLSIKRYRVAISRQRMYAVPSDTPLGPLCEFLRKMFPTPQGEDDGEDREEDLFKKRKRRTVREQLKDEEDRYRAGMAMFNEFERDHSSDEDDGCHHDDDDEEEDEWWDEVTSSEDRSRE